MYSQYTHEDRAGLGGDGHVANAQRATTRVNGGRGDQTVRTGSQEDGWTLEGIRPSILSFL